MTESELLGILQEMKEMFPKINLKEISLEFWQRHCGENYTPDELRRAFDEHVKESDHSPGVGTIRSKLERLFGRRSSVALNTKPQIKPRMPYTEMDFIMDFCTPECVSRELREKFGPDYLRLIGNKHFKSQYKLWVADKLDEISQAWHAGHRPRFYLHGSGETQRWWGDRPMPTFASQSSVEPLGGELGGGA